MPKHGDKPNCCKMANNLIVWLDANNCDGPEEAGWTAPVGTKGFYNERLDYCPFCGHELGDPNRWLDGQAAVERFKTNLPSYLSEGCGPTSDLMRVAEALWISFIEPIERRLKKEREDG